MYSKRFWNSLLVIIIGSLFVSGSPAASAQTMDGSYFKKLELGLFHPSYLERDSPMIARELGLSADERALVEEIVNQYVAVFQMEAEQVQKAIARAEGTSPMALPDLVDRKEIRERAQAEMRPSGDAIRLNMDRGDSAERRERAVEIIREELELELDEPVPDSSRSTMIYDWSNRRLELQEEVLEKFKLIKGLDARHWDAINRALRRINTAWPNLLLGEEVDLDLLLAEHFGAQSTIYEELAPLRMQYAIEYDDALQARNAILSSSTPAILDARDRTHLEKAISLGTSQIQARSALVDINRNWLLRFLEAIQDEQASSDFHRYANMKMCPDAYYGDPPVSTIDYALQFGSFDEETVEALRDLREAYVSEREVWRIVAIELLPEWDRDRLLQEMETNAVALAYRGWLNGIHSNRSSLPAWRKHIDAGLQMDRDYAYQIRAVVSPEVFEAIPGRFRAARRPDNGRGPVPQQKRTANVVYWDEVMSSKASKAGQ